MLVVILSIMMLILGGMLLFYLRKNNATSYKMINPKNFRRNSIASLIFGLFFFALAYKSLLAYQNLRDTIPEYQNLQYISGKIVPDERKSPKGYNQRNDGIYVETANGRLNIYCDNPNRPLVSYGTKGGGTYGLGNCDWIAVKRQREDVCQAGGLSGCTNPRKFHHQAFGAKIDNNSTVYELKVNGRIFYHYDELKHLYLENARFNIWFDACIGLFCLFIAAVNLVLSLKKAK